MEDFRGMYDESVLRRWMSLEMGKINDGIVAARVPLSLLMTMERPSAVTRGGREHLFDRGVIRQMGRTLPEHLRQLLRLPVIFFFDMEVADSCVLVDETALAALQEMGDLSRERQMVVGKGLGGKGACICPVAEISHRHTDNDAVAAYPAHTNH